MSDNGAANNFDSALTTLSDRYAQIERDMNEAALKGNTAQIVALNREYARLRPIVEPYRRRTKLLGEIADHRALIADPACDAELRAVAESELPELETHAAAIEQELIDLMIAGDDATVDSVIMEIRAGTGGDEAALFAGDLLNMYTRFAERHGLKMEIMDASPTELGGFREVILNMRGPGVYRLLGYEGGGHRVQRVPETEQQGRIHTSAATVAVLPEAEEVDIKIDWDKDVIEHVSCAGGPGGQNVNKVASAIKLEHKATGITVSMRDERSQHKNRDKARRILLSRLKDHLSQQEHAARAQTRRAMIGSGDRNERIRTYNFPQNRCTDHRLGESFSLERIIAGEMDDLIHALQARDRQARLKNL
ncbi:MAG: peptide chain release factor 1 [Phycisphaerae bacterium]|nr:peptide chain release factor 1 [Phycisphaerae bacterium]NUQ46313.1 peptide chain release factor 1 [Phycisphaerae bacterium]